MNFKSKIYILIASILIICNPVHAQKKNFTISDATIGLTTNLAVQNLKQTSWQPGTDNFYQVIKNDGKEFWIKTTYPKDKTDTVENLQHLNKAVFGKDELKALPQMNWIDRDYVYFKNKNNTYLGALTAKGIIWNKWLSIPDNAENITVDKSRNVAYTINNNLWIVTADKQTLQITNDVDTNILNGQAVHRNEFGIDGGIFFSPKGDLLAYYHMDQTMVNDYPIIDWSVTPATVKKIKYPMAGGTSHEVTLRVYNPHSHKTVELQTGTPKDHYLTAVTWSPDENYIYIAILNRDQNHSWLNQYSAETGKLVKTLFEETSNTYVEPLHPLSFLPNSNDRFVWWSNKDGYQQLYLYNTDGQTIRKLTNGNYDVNEIVGFNEANHELIITSAKESPLEKHAYTINWDNGAVHRIDKAPGTHTITASDDGQFIYDNYSSADVPRVCEIRSTENNYAKILLTAPNPLADYDRATVKNITLKADDGTPLYGKLILPPNMDTSKKYPVVVYLYNGPHVQLVKNTFPSSGNLWYEYMAQHGYIMFTMDGRGSSNRGKKFEQVTFRHLGTIEMEDQLKGVAYLKSLPYVDSKRMGVHGWSFGGFMTTSLMLRHPGVFKVAVAGGPVMDWSMYEVMYTERYMDTPQQNPEGYATAALYDKVKNLKGKLLLIHGTQDATVVWQHSIKFLKQAVDDNIQVDYFVYPGYEHNVRGKDRVHLMQKITNYFDDYLK